MKPPISVSDQTMFEATIQPIDTLGSFEQVSDSALERNIREQIEYIGAQLLLNQRDPRWHTMRNILVEDVMRAYIARKLIRFPEFEIHWFDSYRIIRHTDGSATVCWLTESGTESRQHFQIFTNLLHSVGREAIRQGYGVVAYKRGQYQLNPDVAAFKLMRD